MCVCGGGGVDVVHVCVMYVNLIILSEKFEIYLELLLGKGDNLQLFISPLLKYEG